MMKMQQIKSVLILILVTVLISCGSSVKSGNSKQAKAQKPNIIFILADDLGYGDVSAYNANSKILTPNIDKLASNGVMFTDAHTSSSVCTPTRYGILTGRYNWRSTLKDGVLNGFSKALIPQDRTTIAGFLRDNGYKTAGIGKWHMGWDWSGIENGEEQVDYTQKIKNGPTTNGFDYWFGFCGSLDMPPYVWVENEQPTAVPTKYTKNTGQASWRHGLTANDFEHEQALPEITKRTVNYINANANQEKPFFIYMPLPAPHTPILPTKEFRGTSGLDNPYGDFVLMVDDVVGQIVAALEKQDVSDNTLIVFTSDNGCSTTANFKQLATKGHDPSYVYRGHKADIFEGGHRVPFIVKYPAKVTAGKSDQLVCTTDFFASVADILNLNESVTDAMAEDSFSFSKALKLESKQPIRTSIVHHSINGSFSYRKGNYKSVFCPGSGGWSFPRPNSKQIADLPKMQLYNLESDIEEKNNLYPENEEIVALHQQELTKIIKEGRSTEGIVQKNDGPEVWPQLWWIEN